MIVFGIRCNFLNDLPVPLKTCRSNGFLFFTRQNRRARARPMPREFVNLCRPSIQKLYKKLLKNRTVKDILEKL